MSAWSSDDLGRLASAEELEIATTRRDGSPRRWTPIWVVVAGTDVFVRTWHRRDTGWFGDVVRSPFARVRVPGLEADVTVADVGLSDAAVRAAVDDAYRAEYGRYGTATVDRMVTDDAALATLRLDRA